MRRVFCFWKNTAHSFVLWHSLSLVGAMLFIGMPRQALSSEHYIPGAPVAGGLDKRARPFLRAYCVDCHSGSEPEAGLSLDTIDAIDDVNAITWKSIWAQVALQEMPPNDSEQPPVIERLRFTDWVVQNLSAAMSHHGGFRAHLDPDKGNFVAHDLLFEDLPKGIELVPTSSPARLWRVTPEEHLTRLNELINTEPAYDPNKPGLRTQGDRVPTNHGGELKLYFGTDRILQWQGGTVAYATAVKSVPAVFSTAREFGLENYPNFYSVNSAESTQILSIADDILRYMAFGPLSIARPEQITDTPDEYFKSEDCPEGDIRGLLTSIVYSTKVVRPLTPVIDVLEHQSATDDQLLAAIAFLFEALTFRPPQQSETDRYLEIVKETITKLGHTDGVVLGLSAIFLDRDALFRPELVQNGSPDAYGRIMLQDWELGLAVNHALRYIKPDAVLRDHVIRGNMRTREDVKREVTRMLNDEHIRKPRVLRFFKDFFDYDIAGYICKDDDAQRATGGDTGTAHYRTMFEQAASTDRLIELILAEDKNVLKELLTTQRVVAGGSSSKDTRYFGERLSPEKEKLRSVELTAATTQAANKGTKQALAQFVKEHTALTAYEEEQATRAEEEKKKARKPNVSKKVAPLTAEERDAAIAKMKTLVLEADELTQKSDALATRYPHEQDEAERKKIYRELHTINDRACKVELLANEYQDKIKKRRNLDDSKVQPASLNGETIYARVSRRSFGNGSLKPNRVLASAPEGQRMGILTHPSWLVSHSDAMDNHAIRRGRWVRERLLGGGLPDIPITVDAMLPDAPHKTLRERMEVTRQSYCWTCHQKMDPLGLPFEMYNHSGLYRTTELDKPVVTAGAIIDSGDEQLDGPVENAMDMIERIASSERAEQVFIRHAFRFWMGRNETLHDGPILQAAHQAYRNGGGSMKALIVSLLTSDAFLYRTPNRSAHGEHPAD